MDKKSTLFIEKLFDICIKMQEGAFGNQMIDYSLEEDLIKPDKQELDRAMRTYYDGDEMKKKKSHVLKTIKREISDETYPYVRMQNTRDNIPLKAPEKIITLNNDYDLMEL